MNKNEQARIELDAILAGLLTDKHMRESDKLLIAHSDAWRRSISATLKGRSLEEMLGKERAAEGRRARSLASKGKKRAHEVGQKIAATRRANGSYENNGMTGRQHKESTKQAQSTKAQIRQDLKRQLGLGRNDSIPKDLLEKEYKKRGL